MTINEYQEEIKKFDLFPKENKIYSLGLGLASEAGEVAGKLKKIIRDKSGMPDEDDIFSLANELGDCLFYLVRLSDCIGYNFSDIIKSNYLKLKDRAERGVIKGSGDNR